MTGINALFWHIGLEVLYLELKTTDKTNQSAVLVQQGGTTLLNLYKGMVVVEKVDFLFWLNHIIFPDRIFSWTCPVILGRRG